MQHFAAKTIENVASTHGSHCTKFATNDTAQVRIKKLIQIRIHRNWIFQLAPWACCNCYGLILAYGLFFSNQFIFLNQFIFFKPVYFVKNRGRVKRITQQNLCPNLPTPFFPSPSPLVSLHPPYYTLPTTSDIHTDI